MAGSAAEVSSVSCFEFTADSGADNSAASAVRRVDSDGRKHRHGDYKNDKQARPFAVLNRAIPLEQKSLSNNVALIVLFQLSC